MRCALLLAAVLAFALPARAAELSLDVGRFGRGATTELGPAGGSLVRLGLAGSRRPHERVELALEGRWGSADADPGSLGVGWAGVSLRYEYVFLSQSLAAPFVGLGFDFGSDLQQRGNLTDVSSPSLSGHVIAGVRVPFTDALSGVISAVGSLDGSGTPALAATLGAAWRIDL